MNIECAGSWQWEQDRLLEASNHHPQTQSPRHMNSAHEQRFMATSSQVPFHQCSENQGLVSVIRSERHFHLCFSTAADLSATNAALLGEDNTHHTSHVSAEKLLLAHLYSPTSNYFSNSNKYFIKRTTSECYLSSDLEIIYFFYSLNISPIL